MARRKPYSKIVKYNEVKAAHVDGMGDVTFLGFQCVNSECTEFITVREDHVKADFSIVCPKCGYEIRYDGETKLFDYDVRVNDVVVNSGEFLLSHEEYVRNAQRFKYCLLCKTLKPLEAFDKHSSRKSGRQGECRQCKKLYNGIKNGTRLTDQHRESGQKRRLLLDIAGNPKINSEVIRNRYGCRCFNCGRNLELVESEKDRPLDHTLPVLYLWPLSTENATLLCRDCNGEKAGKWPSDFYDDSHLRELAIKTGIAYSVLSGSPQYNPDALAALHEEKTVDSLLEKHASHMDEVIKLRNRILNDTGFDFFSVSSSISQSYIDEANKAL